MRYLVENTNRNIVDDKTSEDHVVRYVIEGSTAKKEKKYWKSRRGKDDYGNNTMHYVFMIRDVQMRNDILKLFIKEEIGDIDKRNILGFKP